MPGNTWHFFQALFLTWFGSNHHHILVCHWTSRYVMYLPAVSLGLMIFTTWKNPQTTVSQSCVKQQRETKHWFTICYLSSLKAKVASYRVPGLNPGQLAFLQFTVMNMLRIHRTNSSLFWIRLNKDLVHYTLCLPCCRGVCPPYYQTTKHLYIVSYPGF